MPYTLFVQQLRAAGVTEKTLTAYLADETGQLSEDLRDYLDKRAAEKGRDQLQQALIRWNINYPLKG
ncbi:hypothetical protein [Rhodococcus sp. SJ-2]